jgi:RHS repeat-associated protein
MLGMSHLTQMDWDFKDQLQHVDLAGGGEAFYVYDAGGQRVRKAVEKNGGTLIEERIYLGGFEVFRSRNGSGTVTLERETLHVMDDKQRIALVETRTRGNDGSASQVVRYQYGNHLGSASLELDDAAQIISCEEYYSYGSTSYQAGRNEVEVNLKRYRYTGMERDEESGLNYHEARYYAQWVGRWVSCDPVGISTGTNCYFYGRGNPVVLLDTNGLEPRWWEKPIFFVIDSFTWAIGESPANAPTRPDSPTYPSVSNAQYAARLGIMFAAGGAGGFVGGRVVTSTGSRLLAAGAGGGTSGFTVGVGSVAEQDVVQGEVSSPQTYANAGIFGALFGGTLGVGLGLLNVGARGQASPRRVPPEPTSPATVPEPTAAPRVAEPALVEFKATVSTTSAAIDDVATQAPSRIARSISTPRPTAALPGDPALAAARNELPLGANKGAAGTAAHEAKGYAGHGADAQLGSGTGVTEFKTTTRSRFSTPDLRKQVLQATGYLPQTGGDSMVIVGENLVISTGEYINGAIEWMARAMERNGWSRSIH